MKYLVFLVLLSQVIFSQYPIIQLQKYNSPIKRTTISGISSGGYMAVQLQISNSQTLKAVTPIGSGPYWNGKGDAIFAQRVCRTEPELIDLDSLVEYTKKVSEQGLIDDISNLRDSKIYIVTCEKDTTVVPRVTQYLSQQYVALNANPINEIVKNCEHSYPTSHFGASDPLFKGNPFINNCQFDTAYHTFANMLGPKYLKGDKKMDENNFFTFDQSLYTVEGSGMHEKGFIYIPKVCQDGQVECPVHISFHGCRQTPDHIGTVYARNTGLNTYAESNGVIVLYPQAKINPELGNPAGCWDYWGYTGQDYVLKNGKQNTSVMNILRAITNSDDNQKVQEEL